MRKTVYSGLIVLIVSGLLSAQENPAEDAVKELFQFARAKHSRTEEAARKVVSLGEAASSYLCEDIDQRTDAEIVWGLKCLKNMSVTVDVARLVPLLAHDSGAVRAETLKTLQRHDAAALKSKIQSLLDDDELDVRRAAYDAAKAAASDHAELLQLALKGVQERDFWIATRSVRMLGRIQLQSKEDRRSLLKQAEQIAPKLMGSTAGMFFDFLARQLKEASASVIELTLESGTVDARLAALASASKQRFKKLAPLGRGYLDDDDLKLRLAAVRFASAVKDVHAAPKLIAMLSSTSKAEKNSAVVALRKISGRSIGFEPAKWREWFADAR